MACISNAASADVDSVGGLEKVSTIKSSPHELTPLAGGAGLYQCSSAYQYADVHSEPWGFVIGQCRPGWKFEVLQHTGVNSEHHTSSYGGYLEGAFDACGWIESDEGPEQINEKLPSHCPGLEQKKSTVGTFYEKYNGQPTPTGDGYYTVNKVPCKEYANFRPWSSESVEKEEIRTVPAYATEKTDIPALKWRYVTEYASTDGSGKYVMVRDTRYNGGEGNWVFVPRSCLPATLPESEGELVPSPPTVTTGTPTGIATPNATLVGFVNPNGLDTKYFFEYGTTTSYGSYTATEDAGSGTGVVQEDVPIGGLAPGTTYYFRIVASSATGETFGGPVSFTTQPPPTVTTTAASNVLEEQATLNGTVNPNGLDTKYNFEYGETIAYGSSTTSGDAGSGTNSVPESAIATALRPDRTYHYRLVATSSAGSTSGGDHTFTTPETDVSNRWVIGNSATKSQWVYFDAKEGRVCYYQEFNGEFAWSDNCMGSGDYTASGAHVTVVGYAATNSQWVYFDSKEGRLCYWQEFNGSFAWSENCLGSGEYAAVGTHIAVVSDAETNSQWVYFTSKEGRVCYWQEFNGGFSWSGNCMGTNEALTPASHLTSVVNEATNSQWVYFDAKEGRVCYWQEFNGEFSWSDNCMGAPASVPANSGLATVYNQPAGDQWTYFDGKEGRDCYWQELNSEFSWGDNCMGTGEYIASGSGLAAVQVPASNSQWVYFESKEGRLCYWQEFNNSFGWSDNCLGSGEYVAPGST